MKYFFLLIALTGTSPLTKADQRPVLSLVIDDLGHSMVRGKAAMELEGSHTFAIIPGTIYGRKLAVLAAQEDKEIILHIPLQAANVKAATEPNTLHELMDEDQLSANTKKMLTEFPNIKGINNHMGSHLTQLDYLMRPIMESIKLFKAKLFFLDSRTSAQSIAYREAKNFGLDAISRDVFLDNEHENIESIRLQYQIWLQKAREKGSAVAIGHPHPATIKFLKDNIATTEQSFQFMSISSLIGSASRKEEPGDWNNKLTELQSKTPQ